MGGMSDSRGVTSRRDNGRNTDARFAVLDKLLVSKKLGLQLSFAPQ
jgi:hypothetical protein